MADSSIVASNFLSGIEPWIDAYRRAVISYCAVRKNSSLVVITARIDFRTAEDDAFEMDSDYVETPRLVFERRIISLGKQTLQKMVLDTLERGQIAGLDHLTLGSANADYSSTYYPYRYPTFASGARVPTVVGRGSERSKFLPYDWLESINWELRAASPPFVDMDEAMDVYGLPRLQNTDDWNQVMMVAESPCIISSMPYSSIGEGILNLQCIVSKAIQVDQIGVGLRLFESSSSETTARIKRQSLRAVKWEIKSHSAVRNVLTAAIDVADARVAHVFLSYAGVTLHDAFIQDLDRSMNYRQSIHTAFDANQSSLRSFILNPSQSNAETFEHGIAVLFNLLGFSTALYGQIHRIKDTSVDIVATTPSGRIALIECTIALPSHNNKLSNLSRRLNEVRASMSAHGLDVPIVPILVTALPKSSVVGEVEEMSRLGIGYLAQEDLSEALERTKFHPDPEQFYTQVQELVDLNKTRSEAKVSVY